MPPSCNVTLPENCTRRAAPRRRARQSLRRPTAGCQCRAPRPHCPNPPAHLLLQSLQVKATCVAPSRIELCQGEAANLRESARPQVTFGQTSAFGAPPDACPMRPAGASRTRHRGRRTWPPDGRVGRDGATAVDQLVDPPAGNAQRPRQLRLGDRQRLQEPRVEELAWRRRAARRQCERRRGPFAAHARACREIGSPPACCRLCRGSGLRLAFPHADAVDHRADHRFAAHDVLAEHHIYG